MMERKVCIVCGVHKAYKWWNCLCLLCMAEVQEDIDDGIAVRNSRMGERKVALEKLLTRLQERKKA